MVFMFHYIEKTLRNVGKKKKMGYIRQVASMYMNLGAKIKICKVFLAFESYKRNHQLCQL